MTNNDNNNNNPQQSSSSSSMAFVEIDNLDEENDDQMSMTKMIFSKQIENIVIESEGELSFIDATLSLAEIYGIDISDVPKYITPHMQDKIRDYVISENIIRKSAQRTLFKRQSHYDDYISSTKEAKKSSLSNYEDLWI